MRPQSITILCVLLFVIGTSLTVRSIGQVILLPGFSSILMLIVSILGLYCYYGLWNMKRWSIGLFFVVWAVLAVPTLLEMDGFSTILLMRSLYLLGMLAAFIGVVLPHSDKFTSGPMWQFKKTATNPGDSN